MFKKRVVDWKLNKNYKAAERDAVARIVEQYRNQGNPTPTILVRDQPVKMHRIQRHCKIGRPLTSPFGSAGSFHSSVLNNDAGQIQPRGLIIEYDKEVNPMDERRTRKANIPENTFLFAIPLRHLSPPDELKYAEMVLFQTIFYEWYAQSMKENGTPDSEDEMVARVENSPAVFACKVTAALELGQRGARWRLFNESMDMIKPVLASKDPHCIRLFLMAASG
jgi:hypothetical protein